MAEWSNAPDSKSGIRFLAYRGFESLSFRQDQSELIPSRSSNLSGALIPDRRGRPMQFAAMT